jgi:hypothetical protein
MSGPDEPEKPRRRPSEKRQRNKLTALRWFDDEFNRAAAKADRAGLTFGAYIRHVALGDAGPRAQRKTPVDAQLLRQLLGEVGRVGNNLNQIARALNAGQEASIPDLQKSIDTYMDIRDAIFEALGKDPGPET